MNFIKHHFIFFIRSIRRYKSFAILNLSGLSLGIIAFMYIMSYVKFEQSFDSHHQHAKNIYRITSQKIQDGEPQHAKASASVALAPHISKKIPNIKAVVRIHPVDSRRLIIKFTDKHNQEHSFVEEWGFQAEEDYFKIFPKQLIIGDPNTALLEPNSIVLTQSLAQKYFGDENPVGRIVTMIDFFEMEYEVTGVVKDTPKTTHFPYDFLISFSTFEKQRPHWRWTAWDWDYFHTYVLLEEAVDTDEFIDQVNRSVALAGAEVFKARGYEMRYGLQSIQDIHLYSNLNKEYKANGNGEVLFYLKIIAFFILTLAWVNYVNLSTARASLRAKEIAIRKVTGSSKSSIITQILTESFLFNFTALLISLILLVVFAGFLEPITGYSFQLSLDSSWLFLTVILGLGSLGAGFYPAIMLSNFKAALILKGNFSTSKKGLALRKSLITFQFFVAIVLFIGTISVYRQVSFLRERDIGVNINEVLVTHMPNLRGEGFWQDYDRFKNALSIDPRISMVTTSNEVPGNYTERVQFFKKKGQLGYQAKILNQIWIDNDYFDLFELEILAGKQFSVDKPGDNRWGVMLNVTATKLLGFSNNEEAIGQPVDWIHPSGRVESYTVIGVVNDYSQRAMSDALPMVFVMNRPQEPWNEVNLISIRLNTQNLGETMEFVKEEYDKVYSRETFDSFFLDERFDQQYDSDTRFGKIFGSFSLIAIFIAVLGLFGLTSFIVLQKRKEISVRRVLGAQFKGIVKLISKEFLVQIGIAVTLAIPLAVYILNDWLMRFPEKMTIDLDLFLIPIASLLTIVLLVIIQQSLSSIRVNPTDNLKD